MRIAVFGAGYVGLVTGACFAELGHDVVVRDVVEEKIDALRDGHIPIHEHGLDDLIAKNNERLSFTTDVSEAVDGADVVYIAVGTPPTYSGDADLSSVWTVVDELPRGRPQDRRRDEEHGPGRDRPGGSPPARRSRPRERRLRLESRVHGGGDGCPRLPASRTASSSARSTWPTAT